MTRFVVGHISPKKRGGLITTVAYPVVCGWCRRVIQEGDDRLPVSHGMCRDCADGWDTTPGGAA